MDAQCMDRPAMFSPTFAHGPERAGARFGGSSNSRSPNKRQRDAAESIRQDSELLQKILDGDASSMATLYDKYSQLVYSVSLRALRDPAGAEDVMQEVFLRVWRCPERLLMGRNLAPYLAVSSRNRSIDILRGRRPQESIEDLNLASPRDLALEAERNLLCEKAWKDIDEMPVEQRMVLEMAYFGGLTLAEIARKTGTPLGTAKTRLRSALKHLRRGFPPTSQSL